MSLKGKRRFINLTKVTKHLYCPICKEVFYDASRIRCGHTFCHDCIEEWLKQSAICPICRQNFTEESIQKDLIGIGMVNELEVLCVNEACPWKGTLENLKEHLSKCYFDPKRMPDFVKSILCENSKPNSKDEEKVINASVDFNTNVSLKARLFSKNRELMERVLSKKKNSGGEMESLFDLLTK